MSIRRKIVFALMSIAVTAGLSSAQDPAQLCKLFPGNPEILASATATVGLYKGGCLGAYWPRVQPGLFYDLSEYGAIIMIWPTEAPDIAKVTAAKYQKGRPPTPTYGDGNWETMEDPLANDQRVRHESEFKNRHRGGFTPEEFLSRKPYFNIFTCGNLIISVSANPSKGPAARDLVKEVDSNLRSAGLCGSASTTVVVKNDPPKPPSESTEPGFKVFDGETARQIKEAANRNARHMVVLDRHWDPQQKCWVEERAFVGGIRGSDEDRVSVGVGPSKTFCLNGYVYSTDQVNSAQDAISTAREALAKALETDDRFEKYLKNNPNDANARATYNVNRQWIDYYKKFIANYENAIANSIPPQ